MSDLVEQLKERDVHYCQMAAGKPPYSIMGRAAAEIESLRSRLAALEAERALIVTRAENAERAQIAEMQGERDVAELSRDAAHARLAEAERTIARLSGFTTNQTRTVK